MLKTSTILGLRRVTSLSARRAQPCFEFNISPVNMLHRLFRCVFIFSAVVASPLVLARSAPTADTFKQVLQEALMALKPEGYEERDVLFESARAGKATAASFEFLATLSVRDYDAGYPPNRYFGQTCVSRAENASFKLWLDANGRWKVDGALTLPRLGCKDNPAAGVSSIPLATLSGTRAPAGAAATVAGAATPVGQMAVGEYECWAWGQARLMLNFSTRAPGRYTDSSGKAGSYTMGDGGQVRFKGGLLEGAMPDGFKAVYHTPNGRPTLSFRSASGSESTFCERVR